MFVGVSMIFLTVVHSVTLSVLVVGRLPLHQQLTLLNVCVCFCLTYFFKSKVKESERAFYSDIESVIFVCFSLCQRAVCGVKTCFLLASSQHTQSVLTSIDIQTCLSVSRLALA